MRIATNSDFKKKTVYTGKRFLHFLSVLKKQTVIIDGTIVYKKTFQNTVDYERKSK